MPSRSVGRSCITQYLPKESRCCSSCCCCLFQAVILHGETLIKKYEDVKRIASAWAVHVSCILNGIGTSCWFAGNESLNPNHYDAHHVYQPDLRHPHCCLGKGPKRATCMSCCE